MVCKQGSLRQAIMYDYNNKSSRIRVKVTEADSSMESKLTLPGYKSIKLSTKKGVQPESSKFYLGQNEDCSLEAASQIALKDCSEEVVGEYIRFR